jgi:hypothetical protein
MKRHKIIRLEQLDNSYMRTSTIRAVLWCDGACGAETARALNVGEKHCTGLECGKME